MAGRAAVAAVTPHQLARADCANMMPDGSCLLIEATSLHDYRVALPLTLGLEKWAKLVEIARQKGVPTVRADRRTWEWLDERQPHANRYRLDLCFCPVCHCRVGIVGEMCLDCQAAFYQQREKRQGGEPPFCCECGERVQNCSPGATRAWCWQCTAERMGTRPCGSAGVVPSGVDRRCQLGRGQRCTHLERCILPLADKLPPPSDSGLSRRRFQARQAYVARHQLSGAHQADGTCRDCGAPRAKGRTYCEICRTKRRRASYRRRHGQQQCSAPHFGAEERL